MILQEILRLACSGALDTPSNFEEHNLCYSVLVATPPKTVVNGVTSQRMLFLSVF